MTRTRYSWVGIVLWAATLRLHAQHYPVGSKGIKAGSLPAPGFTVEDDNSFYFFDRISGFDGQLNHLNGFNYVQTPRLTWMTHLSFLNTDIGAGIRVPFAYKQVTLKVPFGIAGPLYGSPSTLGTKRQSGLGDIEVQPILLAWHLKHFDFSTGYSFWAPTGDYDRTQFFEENIGTGYWTHSFMVGFTWYPDSEKTWAVSLLNHFDINTEQPSTRAGVTSTFPTRNGPVPAFFLAPASTTLGDIYTLEWAVSKSIKDVDVGLTGYYQQQVTDTLGPTLNGPTWGDEMVHVAAIGPEIQYNCERWGMSASLRYDYEFSAMDHTRGNLINLTVSKSF
jgi:hypothetical protein